MSAQNIIEVVTILRQRLVPIALADTLTDTLEGQFAHARKAAVLLGLFEQEGKASLLFIRRAVSLRAHSGEIAFPGGGVDLSDTTPVITALREAQEEIGLAPSSVEVLGLLPPVFTVVSNYLIIPVVGYLPHGLGTLQLQASEVTEVFLAPLHSLTDPAIFHTEEWVRGGHTHTVHFYDYSTYRIWGVTARILNALLEMLR